MLLASARVFVALRDSPYEEYADLRSTPNDPTGTFGAAAHHHWIYNSHLSFPSTSASDPRLEACSNRLRSFSPLAPSSSPTAPGSSSPEDASGGGQQAEEKMSRSERHDEDWYRLVGCHEPFALDAESILRGPVFSPGTFSGPWEGLISVRP